MIQKLNESSEDVMKRLNITKQWCEGDLSNFEYLMQINRISGRYLQDITQYPIFPWVLLAYPLEDMDTK